MEFKELQHLLICPICLLQYDTVLRAPLIVPCRSGHTICKECAKKILASPHIYMCPLDNEVLQLREKNITAFQQSLDLQKFIRHFSSFEFCRMHPYNIMDIACLKCHGKICYRCDKNDHQGHRTETVNNIWKKIEEKHLHLRGKLEAIEEADTHRKSYLQRKESELIQNFKAKLNSYIDELVKKGDYFIDEIKSHFSKLRTNLPFKEESKSLEIFKWKEDAVSELNRLDPEIWRIQDDKLIPYCIFDQEEAMERIGAEEWIRTEGQRFEKLREEAERISVGFNEEYWKVLRENPIGNLNSPVGGQEDTGIRSYSFILPRIDYTSHIKDSYISYPFSSSNLQIKEAISCAGEPGI